MHYTTKKLLDNYINEKYSQIVKSAKTVQVSDDQDINDIIHENLIYLYETPDVKIKKMIKEKTLHLYISRCIKLSAISNKSKYRNKYKFIKNEIAYCSFNDQILSTRDEEKEKQYYESVDLIYNKIIDYLNTIHWYDRAVYLQYMSGDNYRTLNEKTNIPITSLVKTIVNVKKKVQLYIKENKLN